MIRHLLFLLHHQLLRITPIRIQREVLNGCWDALVENRATLVIGATGEPPIGLICGQRSIGSIDFAFVVSHDHPLTKLSQPLSPKNLEPFPTIVVSDTSFTISKRSSGIISRQQKIIVPTIEDKIQAQIQGLGVGYLPLPRIQDLLDEGQLIELKLSNQSTKKAFFKLAWNSESLSPTLHWFLEHLQSKSILNQFIS